MKLKSLILLSSLAQVASAAYVRHNNPAGFRVEHPEGWTVETPRDSTIIIRSQDAASFVMIHGFVNRGQRAAEWVSQSLRGALAFFPNAVIGLVQQQETRPYTVIARLTFSGARGEAKANILCTIAGGAGTLMVMAAPQGKFETQRAVLGHIVQSFSFTTPSGTPARAPANVTYVGFRDPREGAFTVEVPQAWRTQGGLFRFAPVDVRPALETVSPDGQIRITIGDQRIPTFMVPNQTLAMTGFREGSTYSPGYGVQMQVRRYMPGATFAEYYSRQQVGQGGNFRVLDRRDRDDFAAATNPRNGGMTNTHAGELAFGFSRNGQPFGGYCLAATTLTSAYGTATWNVGHLYCFTAPENLIGMAQSVIRHMMGTAQVSPQWAAMQQGVAAHSSQTVAQTNAYVSRVISQSYWERSASQDRMSRNRSDATLGIVRLEDPVTGERFTATNGSNYYSRIAGANTVLGNNTGGFPPQLDTRPLVQLQ